MKTVLIAVLMVVLLAVVGVGAFFAGQSNGMAQAQNIRAEFFQGRQGAQGGTPDATGQNQRGQTNPYARGGQGAQFGRAATGTVKSVQGNKIEITSRDGSTLTVTLDAQTIIQKVSGGSASDIQAGQAITVTTNPQSGDSTATLVQIRQGQ